MLTASQFTRRLDVAPVPVKCRSAEINQQLHTDLIATRNGFHKLLYKLRCRKYWHASEEQEGQFWVHRQNPPHCCVLQCVVSYHEGTLVPILFELFDDLGQTLGGHTYAATKDVVLG